jgi:hypothetical protein
MTHSVLRIVVAATVACSLTWPLQAEAQTKPKKEPTAAQMAARERQQKCSAEWKAAKVEGKLPANAKWPKFWSECNSRLKGSSI